MSQTLRVLSVDDSENDKLLLVWALEDAGYAVECTRVDTAGAMRAALDQQAFDIAFLDHRMPEFSDLAALAVLKERGLHLPCIVLSGGIPEHEVVKVLKAGAHDFVHKADLSQLGAAVERVIREVAADEERKRVERALRESEARYALAVQGSRDGIWDWDLATGQAYYSPRLKELLAGVELLPRVEALRAALHPEDRERFQQALEIHWAQRAPFDVEVRALTTSGECRWLSVRGQSLWTDGGAPVRMAGSLTDLTERKLSEARLRDNLQIIARQQEAIQVLSTPIIEVWEGVLTVPILTAVDAERAAVMTHTILDTVSRTRCRHLILDLTGVQSIESETADRIIRLIRAVQMLGSEGIVVGIHPSVARTLVSIGTELAGIHTMANVRQALILLMSRGTSRRAP